MKNKYLEIKIKHHWVFFFFFYVSDITAQTQQTQNTASVSGIPHGKFTAMMYRPAPKMNATFPLEKLRDKADIESQSS